MKDEIFETFQINEATNYEFRKICGFTIAFSTRILTMRGRLASAEIRPAGIFYEENGEYYLAPLDETINIEAVVEEFVSQQLKNDH